MIAAAINRCIWYALFGIGLALVAFGVYFGAFAWANDGLIAGVGVFGTSAGFGCALVITGLAFRFVAEAHAKVQPRRWWLQLLPLLVGYVAFGLAASMSSVLERKTKEWKKKETAGMRRPLPDTALASDVCASALCAFDNAPRRER